MTSVTADFVVPDLPLARLLATVGGDAEPRLEAMMPISPRKTS
jgi:hypothetical protein